MSYCRFITNDAYIYATYTGFECCGCSLMPTTKEQEEMLDAPFFRVKTPREILDHIAEHRAKGDYIKPEADERIKEDFPDLDADISETEEERLAREERERPARERMLAKMKAAYEATRQV